ncbi:hypothetical protein NL676_001784 [Syzygium grande]|nr:hypothetical protein NL676_001784 [Syzygium grande]
MAMVNSQDQEKEDNPTASSQFEYHHLRSITVTVTELSFQLWPAATALLPPSPRSSPTTVNGWLAVLEMKAVSKPGHGEALAIGAGFRGRPQWKGEHHASHAIYTVLLAIATVAVEAATTAVTVTAATIVIAFPLGTTEHCYK